MEKIALYNQNTSRPAQRAWNADENNGDVTWYDATDLVWAKSLTETTPKNSNELYRWKIAQEIVREFGL